MFVTLLIVTLIIAAVVSGIVVILFARPISNILGRIVADQISSA